RSRTARSTAQRISSYPNKPSSRATAMRTERIVGSARAGSKPAEVARGAARSGVDKRSLPGGTMRTAFLASLLLLGCSSAQKPPADDARTRAQAVVAAPDRTPRDRDLDPGRKPAETLEFLRLQPGMKVAELGAGAGYTTELLARSVAPDGVVYAQNPDLFIQRFLKTAWPERLARPAMKNGGGGDREFVDPLPPGGKGPDLGLINVTYPDTVWLKVDRAPRDRTR